MKAIVVANWKMHPATSREAKALFESMRKSIDKAKGISLIVAPPAIYLRNIVQHYSGKRITFALQNASAEASGSHTGEISFAQGKDAKASAVIIGHAERRAMGETNDDVRRKVAAALAQKITPILCIGETMRDSSGAHFTYVKEQLKIALIEVPPQKIGQILIAYEPVWAIGAARAMDPRDMHEMTIFIRKTIVEMLGKDGMNVRILYGGSVDEGNAPAMLRDGAVNGFLVGRASVEPHKFNALIQSLANA